MSKALIALVATALMVDGERVVIPPGQPLPELKDKDRDELLAARAARAPVNEAGATPADAPAPAADAGETVEAAPAPTPKPAAKKRA